MVHAIEDLVLVLNVDDLVFDLDVENLEDKVIEVSDLEELVQVIEGLMLLSFYIHITFVRHC